MGSGSAVFSAGTVTDSQNEARLAAEELKRKADMAAIAAKAKADADAAAKASLDGRSDDDPVTVIINVAGTVTAQEDLEKAIQDAINKSRAAGNVDALAPRSWRGEV